MNLLVPYTGRSFLASWGTLSLASRTLLHGVTSEGLQPAIPRPPCVRPCLTGRQNTVAHSTSQRSYRGWFESAMQLPTANTTWPAPSTQRQSTWLFSQHPRCVQYERYWYNTDTVKWHSLCTCVYVCVIVCMYVCIDLFICGLLNDAASKLDCCTVE